jgi:hypothetical protein
MTHPLRTYLRMKRTKMTNYPETLSMESVATVIEIVKNREVDARKQELALAGWNVAGFLLKTFVGEPVKEVGCDNPDCDCTDEEKELLAVMGAALVSMQEEGSFSVEDEKAGWDISILLTLLPLLLELLQALGIYNKDGEEETDV